MVNEDVRHIVESELREGEQLLWADKPRKFPLSFMQLYSAGFALIWITLCVFFVEDRVLTSSYKSTDNNIEPSLLTSFGVEFVVLLAVFSLLFLVGSIWIVLFGLKQLIGPSKEVYALTNKRGIVISPFLKYRVGSVSPNGLRDLERTGQAELRTLFFPNHISASTIWQSFYPHTPRQYSLNAFRKIAGPEMVEDLIYRTFHKDKTP